jgi:phenylpropionate dioxygenase-like ring-hydroxylating dioxygenase large terminal subunit
MERDAQIALLERVLAQVESDRNAYGPAETRTDPRTYWEPERLRAEEPLFRRYPYVVGHASEIPAPGDYMTHDLAGVAALIVRGADGAVRAFHNVCRHRGTRLVGDERGHAKAFACRYHAWTYDLGGALKHVPQRDAFPGLECEEVTLAPIPAAVHCGLIWIAPDARAPLDIAAHLGPFGAELATFGLGDQVVFRTNARVRRCNWKLIVEAFLEPYHVRTLHRASIGRYFVDRGSVFDLSGAHIRSCVPRHNVRELLALPRTAWDARVYATTEYFFFPATILVLNPDYWSVIRVFPHGPEECWFVNSLLIPAARHTDAEREHWEKSYQLVDQTVFEKEDCEIAESIQSGVRSGVNASFRIGRMEYPIRAFHDSMERALGLR